MTVENVRYISPDEIVGYEFRCNSPTCGTRLRLPLVRGTTIPRNCPRCDSPWHEANDPSQLAASAVSALANSLADVEKLSQKLGCGFYIELRSESQE